MIEDAQSSSSWQKRAELLLATLSAARKLTTYAEFADAARVPGPQRIYKLTKWLEISIRNDCSKPPRAALVISRARWHSSVFPCREIHYTMDLIGPKAIASEKNLQHWAEIRSVFRHDYRLPDTEIRMVCYHRFCFQ